MEQFGGKSIPKFAADWGIGESTVWGFIRQGLIKTVKIGPRITRIPYTEEQRLVEQGGVGGRVTTASQVRESA